MENGPIRDTHAIARSLTDAEFTPAQADAVTAAVRDAADPGGRAAANQFAALDGRLDRVDARFDRVDARLDALDGRLDRVDARLDALDGRLDRVEAHLDRIEARLDRMIGASPACWSPRPSLSSEPSSR